MEEEQTLQEEKGKVNPSPIQNPLITITNDKTYNRFIYGILIFLTCFCAMNIFILPEE